MAGLPVGQQPVASGAEAAVAAQAVPALMLALVQCLTLVEICGTRGVKARGEGSVPSGATNLGQPGSHVPSQHSKDHSKWWTGQQEGHEVFFGDKVVSELPPTPFPGAHSPVQVPFLLL